MLNLIYQQFNFQLLISLWCMLKVNCSLFSVDILYINFLKTPLLEDTCYSYCHILHPKGSKIYFTKKITIISISCGLCKNENWRINECIQSYKIIVINYYAKLEKCIHKSYSTTIQLNKLLVWAWTKQHTQCYIYCEC